MLEFIHRIRILVHNADAVAQRIPDNFRMTPPETRSRAAAVRRLTGRGGASKMTATPHPRRALRLRLALPRLPRL